MQAKALEGGFAVPPLDAARAFRAVMEAMARPGTLQDIVGATPPAPLSPAAGTVLLTLCDSDTPVHLAGDMDTPDLRAWIAFHTGAPFAEAGHCMFAVGGWQDLMPLSIYPVGTSDYPDRSATLIVDLDDLTTTGAALIGPGIRKTALLSLPEVDAFEANHALFPLGLDFILTCRGQVAALPRSTRIDRAQTTSEGR
jgi:alpha-D-ribose 1-methylphosphonate 5-triphosphate synthase subunit PhnH